MRIQKFNYQVSPKKESSQTQKPFTSLLRVGDNGLPIDSSFYRDIKTLKAVKDALLSFFPKGSLTIDAGCSNAEEYWSLKTLLGINKNHKIIGLDINPDAINLAKKKVYSVFTHYGDSFLIEPKDKISPEEADLQDLFNQYFVPTRKPKHEINNSMQYIMKKAVNLNFKEKFFKLRKELGDELNICVGDINDIVNINSEGQKLSAVLFRNAIYHSLDNDVYEHLRKQTNANWKSVDRQSVCSDFADKIHYALDENGVFAIGDHVKDHFFIADDFTPSGNTTDFLDFNPSNEIIEKFKLNTKRIETTKICKESPLKIALERDGRFNPIAYSDVEFIDRVYQMPTVWQKVK